MATNNYGGDDDLIFNTASRIPVCLCVDTSASMLKITSLEGAVDTGREEFRDGRNWRIYEGGHTILGDLVNAINAFYDAIRSNEQAKLSCEIAIVTFNDVVNCKDEFATIDRKENLDASDFDCDGDTSMGAGVEKALDLLEQRKNEYKANGVDYFQPWIVILTDGVPTDDTSNAVNRCLDLEAAGKLTVFPIALNDEVDMEVLSTFSAKRKPIKIKEGKLDSFFEWLGKSVSIVSSSQVGEKIKLDTSTMDDWADLE